VTECCWVDLGVADVGVAADFYAALLGWDVADPDPTGYRSARLGADPVAAFGRATDPGPPYWTVYVPTVDIEASVATVLAAGGCVVDPPAAVGGLWISAMTRDADGTPLSWWQAETFAGFPTTGAPGTPAGARRVPAEARPSPWLVSFHVRDVDEARHRALALGATPSAAGLIDPTGAEFGLLPGPSAAAFSRRRTGRGRRP
jgi:predicted enzyme related to lactoylglutathione lyase